VRTSVQKLLDSSYPLTPKAIIVVSSATVAAEAILALRRQVGRASLVRIVLLSVENMTALAEGLCGDTTGLVLTQVCCRRHVTLVGSFFFGD
jgi:hypothetical protein